MPKLTKREQDDAVIAHAIQILHKRLRQPGVLLDKPDVVVNYLRLNTAELEHEVFGVLFLDIKNRLIADEILFHGTLSHTAVYPRELVKKALRHNAHSILLYHNHPSGEPEPSHGDNVLTSSLKSVLSNISVNIVDHIIIAGQTHCSYAEKGVL